MPEPNRYLGKFRGTVAENIDPMRLGRLRVRVPDVLGDTASSWAMPCFPLSGPRMGHYAVPPVGAGVWVEFEQGDVSFPIWVGCWFGAATEVPPDAFTGPADRPNIVVRTGAGHQILLCDLPGSSGIKLTAASGAEIVIDDSGITLDNGHGARVTLKGSTVDINDGALAIT
ncbi:phage baseplate assembly protein V [Actinoplanes sp. NPDC024001]|uniref:phage baseplate assembly protein V n=1 Tax=Actinoplanes sp. NPDC024001 TaxID=3154598 RepID=UPI0034021339